MDFLGGAIGRKATEVAVVFDDYVIGHQRAD
jgi:hypothetical protein